MKTDAADMMAGFKAGVERAYERSKDGILPTAFEAAPELGHGRRADVLIKWESRQRTGSFKMRGALNKVRSLASQAPDAVLGVAVQAEEVPTLTGTLALRIPPETQSGRSLRLNGQGMPILGKANQRGDLYVKMRVKVPTGLSEEEKSLFRELAAKRRA